MVHGLLGRQALHVIVLEETVEKVERVVADVLLVVGVDEALPRPSGKAAKDLDAVVLARE